LFYIICVWNVSNNVTSKLRMHGAEKVNAKGTELLDRVDRIQTPDRKGAVGKTDANRKALRFVLRILSRGSELGVEWKTKWKLQLVLC